MTTPAGQAQAKPNTTPMLVAVHIIDAIAVVGMLVSLGRQNRKE